MSGELRSLLAVFRVKFEGVEKLKDADATLRKVISAAMDLGEALAGGAIVVGLKNFVQGQVDLATGLDQTARILGVTTDELQQFHLAAELSNTSVEAVDSALRFLNRTIGSEGGEGIGAKGAKELKALGISLQDAAGKSRPVIDVFADLADKLKETGDTSKATEIAMQVLGRGGARSLPLLMQGGEALRKKFAELKELGGGISPESIEAAKKMQVAEVRLKYATAGLGSELMAGLVPGLARGVQRMKEITVAFKTWIDTTTFFRSFPLFVQAGAIAAGIYGIVKAASALNKALALMGTSSWQILGIVAALSALYVIFDDVMALFNGDDSEIGAVLDDMFGKGYSADLVTSLKDAWEGIMASFKGGDWKPFFDDLRDSIPVAVKGLVKMAQMVKAIYHVAKEGVDVVGSAIVGDGTDRPEVQSKEEIAKRKADPGGAIGAGIASRVRAVGAALGAAQAEEHDDIANFGGNPAEKAARDAAAASVAAGKRDSALATAPNAGLPPPPAPVHIQNLNVHLPNVKDAGKVPDALNREFDKIRATTTRDAYGAVGGT